MEQPEKIGRYKIEGQLGSGGMGVVYKARDPLIDRTVAIKMIQFEKTEDADTAMVTSMKARFKKEAQAAGRLSHPNIVTIYDVGEDEGYAYIAMEFIEGIALGDVMQSEKARNFDFLVDLFVQICDGLDYAHKREIVHRDIKPSNIIVTEEGIPKILDFGIAYQPSSETTKTGIILGTPYYMSPEQVMGRKVTNRSDLFSLGIILYEFLTGERPFTADTTTVAMYKLAHEPFIPPSYKNPKIPKGFDTIIDKALAKSPEERYESCMALADDLKNYARLVETDETGMLTIPEDGMTTLADEESVGIQEPAQPAPPRVEPSAAVPSVDEIDKAAEPDSRVRPSRRRSRWWIAPLLLFGAAGLAVPAYLYGPQEWRDLALDKLADAGLVTKVQPYVKEVTFNTEPQGAAVLLDGVELPGRTPLPWRFEEEPGKSFEVAFRLDRHREDRRTITLDETLGDTIDAELVEEIRDIRITTTPKKSKVTVKRADGEKIKPGDQGGYTIRNDVKYLVSVSRAGYFPLGPLKVRGRNFKATNHYSLKQERKIIIRQGANWAKACKVSGPGVESTHEYPTEIILGKGSYELTVENPEIFFHKVYQADLSQQKSVPILPPPIRTITIGAVPSACTIFVDGLPVGEPPIADLSIVEGEHELEFRWRSGEVLKKSVRVTSQDDQRFFEAKPDLKEQGGS